jgi:hypothetical protein
VVVLSSNFASRCVGSTCVAAALWRCGCVCVCRDNPFARAAAQGQVEKNAPILQAVAYDLDTLQVCVVRQGKGKHDIDHTYTVTHLGWACVFLEGGSVVE